MKLSVSHRFTLRFDPPRRRYLQSHRLYPSVCASQSVEAWRVTSSQGVMGASFTDGAGDQTETLSVPGEIDTLTLQVEGTVRTFDTLGVLRDLREKVPPHAYLSQTRLVRADAAIAALAREALAGIGDDKPLDRSHALAQAVTDALTEDRTVAAEQRPAAEVIEGGTGNATDHAHLLIAAAHAVDMPARFVCGYFVRGAQQAQIGNEDTADLPAVPPWPAHAWAELWVEGLGWVGFDCVHECCPDERFVRLCSGRDGADAAPLRGAARGSGAGALEVALDVQAAEQ